MKKSNVGVILITSVLVSFICGALGGYLIIENTYQTSNSIIKHGSIKLIEDSSIEMGVSNVYDAVVVVEGFKNGTLVSTGTGFVYKTDNDVSYIMTNHHVISGSDAVKVILSDKTEVDVKIKGSEVYSDIAVLEIATKKIKSVAVMGSSNSLNVGDTVFTVGSPEGSNYAGTVTKGILSGKDRLVEVALSTSTTTDYYMKVLQTDAAINPGNSGGPICNINGEVVGVTNMKLVDSTVEGIGFAIPIEDALNYASILEKGEEVIRPYIGIGMLDVDDSYTLWQNGITINSTIDYGVVIMEVATNSPAEASKLKKGDVILSINGNKVSSVAEFRYELYKYTKNDKIELEIVRGNKNKKVSVTLSVNNS